MKTLKELIIDKKCRKGESSGTTKRGAFWLAAEPCKIRSYGGDGVGQNSPDRWHKLHLRHFRSGEVQAIIHCESWHQNGSYSGGGESSWFDVSRILECSTIEDVIVCLKSENCGETHAYADFFREKLEAELEILGLPRSLPAPDEVCAS